MVEVKTGADPLYQEVLLFDMNWFRWWWPQVFLLRDLFICALTVVHSMGWLALDLMHKPHVFTQSFLTYYPTLESGVYLSIVSRAVAQLSVFQ